MTSLPVDSPNRNAPKASSNRRKGKRSRTKKIEELVAEGAKNYPAYLKLIYTGDSEQSSEGEEEVAAAAVNRPPGHDGVDGEKRGAAKKKRGRVIGHHQGDKPLSPESDKLLDPGKEKPQTPNDSKAQEEEEKEKEKEKKEDAGDDIAQNTVVAISNESDKRKLCNEEQPNDNQQQQPDNNHRSNEEQWTLELFQLQDDIISLKEVLNGKLRIAADLKQRLGMTPLAGFRQSLLSLKDSGSYFKTSTVLRSMVAYASNKMGTIRNSVIFKSVEEKVVKVKSRSMSEVKPTLRRKLSGSKSDSRVFHLDSSSSSSSSSRDRDSSCEEEGKTTDCPLPPPMDH